MYTQSTNKQNKYLLAKTIAVFFFFFISFSVCARRVVCLYGCFQYSSICHIARALKHTDSRATDCGDDDMVRQN